MFYDVQDYTVYMINDNFLELIDYFDKLLLCLTMFYVQDYMIVKGINLSPYKLDTVLMEHPHIANAMVSNEG